MEPIHYIWDADQPEFCLACVYEWHRVHTFEELPGVHRLFDDGAGPGVLCTWDSSQVTCEECRKTL